ncbi:HNH endonuclease [Pontibacterium sp. N1Y112]|uniref:HNH endonuclease n=1 Tax=Pontibacterium sinense TaxID=2781979 RepID=A0A8J7FGP4_9GAMM|nr:HNH endonuclease signature motif containing protein [Pontibacterium sinense]MBE9395653.1 HNH endonuclease [Pontibacterium sinense]
MPTRKSKLKNRAFNRQKGRCYYCNALMWLTDPNTFSGNHQITAKQASRFQCTSEHLVARCDGGKDTQKNIVAACRFCNAKRHQRSSAPDPVSYKQLITQRKNRGKWHPQDLLFLTTD